MLELKSYKSISILIMSPEITWIAFTRSRNRSRLTKWPASVKQRPACVGPLLLTRITFNISLDKWSHAL